AQPGAQGAGRASGLTERRAGSSAPTVACPPAVDLPAIEREDWDCIIVGTGMGGAMLGYVLAPAGKRVLWCERGHRPSADAIRGSFAEAHFPRPEAPSERHREILARAGRASEMIED